jgi:hypothetical protein
MSESAEPFVVDPEAAAHALVLAEAAARNVLDLREDPPTADLHLALFSAPAGSAVALPDAADSEAVIAFMDRLSIADHGPAGTSVVVEALGFSKKEITRLKAFECVRTGVDAYAAILARRKFDGATRSYGSHLFDQIMPGGATTSLIAAASGWRGDQDYLAAMVVPATLQCVLSAFGVLPRDVMVCSGFVLSGGAWEYPGV